MNWLRRHVQTDAYQATGCYNLLCSGFVQTSNVIAIGAAITPISSSAGSQYDIRILIWKVSAAEWNLITFHFIFRIVTVYIFLTELEHLLQLQETRV